MDHMQKKQIIQNKLLTLLLKWDRRTPTDFVHQRLSILKVNDVHSAKVISFVNECRASRVPDIFVEYFRTRETGLNLRNQSSLDIPWARTDMGLSRCDVRGAWLLNNYLQTVTPLLHTKRASINKFLNSLFVIIIRLNSSFVIVIRIKLLSCNYFYTTLWYVTQ